MPGRSAASGRAIRVAAGLAVGAAIAAVDNFASGGEVSPVLVVALLFVATALSGAVWGSRGWVSSASTWACVPSAHLVKHLAGLPDTLQPNTYPSIIKLAAFTLVIGIVGTLSGMLLSPSGRTLDP